MADEDDLAAHVDAARRQPVVVLGLAVAGVDDRGGDVAGLRIRVIGNAGVGVLHAGMGIAGDGFFPHRRAPRAWRGHLDADFLGPGEKDVMGRDGDLFEAGPLEALARPLGELAIARGTRQVRLVGEHPMGVAYAIGRRPREKAPLDLVAAPPRPSA